MFIAEPPRTQYDLHFRFTGFDVRVTPLFWVAAAVLGWNAADAYHGFLGEASPGQGALLLIWIAAVFISILIHELGHAVAMRYYGRNAYIVLYHFGGIAVSDSAGSFMQTGRFNRSDNQIVISAAGPGVQLLLAAVIILAVKLAGYSVPLGLLHLVGDPLQLTEGPPIPSVPLWIFVNDMLSVNILWALMNLLPVYPLDGGQIARELLTMHSRDGIKNSLMLSVGVGIAAAAFGFMSENLFLGIMFAMLAFSSYQILQAYYGRGGGFGGGQW